MKVTKKGIKLTKFERFIFIFTIALLVLSPLMSIFAKSILSKASYEVEETKSEISEVSKSNESLQMKINELASLDNLESVAKELGLKYTSNSVKTVK